MRYIFRTFLFVAVFAGFVPGAFGATILYSNGFETGDLTGLKLHKTVGATIGAVTTPVASGKYSMKYDLVRLPGQDSYRAETPLFNGNPSFEFYTEYWVGMSYVRTDWAPDRSAEAAPMQIHRVPSKWGTAQFDANGNEIPKTDGCGGEVSAFSVAPVAMFNQNDTETIITAGGARSWSAPIVKNKWQNLVFHFKFTFDGRNTGVGKQLTSEAIAAVNNYNAHKGEVGYIEVWKDGVKLFRRDGHLHTGPLDDCDGPWQPTTWNMGIYKWDWKANSKQISDSTRRTLYLDDVKIAKGTDGYTQVSNTTPTTPITPEPPTPTPGPTPPPLPPGDGITLTIYRGQSATLRWNSTTASSCQGSGGWSGPLAISGTQSVSPTISTDYTLACTNAIGVTTKTVHVIVVAP